MHFFKSRDLSGSRLRDINDEDRLKRFVAKKAEREREEKEKKEAKLNRLKRIVNEENKHEFTDTKYMNAKAEDTAKVQDAMEHGKRLIFIYVIYAERALNYYDFPV